MAFSVAWDSDRARQHAEDEATEPAAALAGQAGDLAALSEFRAWLYRCFTARADELVRVVRCDLVLAWEFCPASKTTVRSASPAPG